VGGMNKTMFAKNRTRLSIRKSIHGLASASRKIKRPLYLLCFSGGTLDSHPYHQPDRIDVCHRPLRAKRTKGCGSRAATLTMVYKLVEQVKKHWRKMNGHALILKLIEGIKFKDGITDLAA
jgi:hypothetical protein